MKVATLEDTVEDTKRGKSRVSLVQNKRALRHALDDLIAGTGEPAGMEEVVKFAAQHMGFSDQRTLASNKLLPGIENPVPSREHECAYQTTLMNPAIWSDLPEELLQRVFARLPLAGIIRLRCLSKQWNRILKSHNFKQVCANAHPKLFAIISGSWYFGSFEVRLYDLRSNTWHAMQIDTEYQRRNFHTMNASDGGLVCIACTATEEESFSVLVLVCNPLTCVVRALPLHSHYKRPPKMLQLVMDRISKCYQVLIVSTDRNGGLVAEIFHSNTGAWTTANLSEKRYFSGCQYRWLDDFNIYLLGEGAPIVYDCAEGHFLEIPALADLLKDGNYFTMNHCALVQDRLFVLCRKEREAIKGGRLSELELFFAEFQFLESGAKWLKLKDHRSTNFKFPGSTRCYPRSVLACKGFMLVVTCDFEEWSYDLPTRKWHALSPGFLKLSRGNLMCELQWDAVP